MTETGRYHPLQAQSPPNTPSKIPFTASALPPVTSITRPANPPVRCRPSVPGQASRISLSSRGTKR